LAVVLSVCRLVYLPSCFKPTTDTGDDHLVQSGD
jgi:hypothetical protein